MSASMDSLSLSHHLHWWRASWQYVLLIQIFCWPIYIYFFIFLLFSLWFIRTPGRDPMSALLPWFYPMSIRIHLECAKEDSSSPPDGWLSVPNYSMSNKTRHVPRTNSQWVPGPATTPHPHPFTIDFLILEYLWLWPKRKGPQSLCVTEEGNSPDRFLTSCRLGRDGKG